jgi:DNA repair protein RecN (Recombination protein N)
MLAELRIVNFALIEQLHIQFQSGFTVLTGETGAGKSLLIDAIGLLVGGRASVEQIRSGQDEAHLEASFHLPLTHTLLEELRAQDLIGARETNLILKRILSRSGRHRVYVNGSLCPLRVLEELGGSLVDIHGQHEQQSLLASTKQLHAIDAFGSTERAQYETAYREWRELAAHIELLRRAGVERARMEELLRFQVQEIEQAGLSADEEDRLKMERQRLLHAHRLRELAESSYAALQGDERGTLSQLATVGRCVSELAHIDPDMEDCEAQVREAIIHLKDVTACLRGYADDLEADPARQATVEDRLDLIHRLKTKYGGSTEAVLETGKRAKQELETLEEHEAQMSGLLKRLNEAESRVIDKARQLTKKRREAAKRLAAMVAKELTAVRMEHTLFDIAVTADEELDRFGPTGRDRVEFLLSSNVGEPPRPLNRVASGGELSRIMLALKTVLAETDQVPVLVFDEIDTGVGGAVAAAMGTRLRKLGAYHQVFCITHLPQVASQAQHHVIVEKGQDGRRTTTSVRVLSGVSREEEIARMLGGETVTKKIRETAAELIAGARVKR